MIDRPEALAGKYTMVNSDIFLKYSMFNIYIVFKPRSHCSQPDTTSRWRHPN